MHKQMKWASALSTRPSLEAAVKEVAEQAMRSLEAQPDLGIVFISSAFASEFSRLMPLLQEHLTVPVWIGCSGGGVVGVNDLGQIQEVEDKAALSLSLASLPDVKVYPFHVDSNELPDLDSSPNQWSDLIGVAPQEHPHFILLSDPFSSGINDLLQGLDFAYPGSVKLGGLASVASISNSSGLFYNARLLQQGTVGVALSGNICLETIVSQGCRPIGKPYRVAEAERNVLLKVEEQGADGIGEGVTQTPLEALQEIFQTLDPSDRELAQHSLFVGIAQSEFKQQLEAGDFLIRNLLGVDPRNGAIAIGDRVRLGQRVQFHLRDAKASASDLETLLEGYQLQNQVNESTLPIGALMFSCMGRGKGLYGQANFDSGLFSQYFQQVPLGGFFCGGEIGPVGGSTFLHGYTSVFAICRSKD
jgi:small ligand-binding sensory domain FIST